MTKQNLNGGAGNQVAATAMVFETQSLVRFAHLPTLRGSRSSAARMCARCWGIRTLRML